MSRCAICDYVEGAANLSTPNYVPRYSSRVRWRSLFSEFQCDDCHETISLTASHWKQDDQIEGEIETLDDVPEDTPALPEVPLK